jgi:hypothetical protein
MERMFLCVLGANEFTLPAYFRSNEFDPTAVISKKDKANELKAVECANIGHMH